MPRVNVLPPYLGPAQTAITRITSTSTSHTGEADIESASGMCAPRRNSVWPPRPPIYFDRCELVENRTRAGQLLLTIGEIVGGEDARLRWHIRSQAHGASS